MNSISFLFCSFLLPAFLSIQRRQFEQIKEAVPVVLNVLKSVSAESDNGEDDRVEYLIAIVINIATSMQEVCQNIVCDTSRNSPF